MLKEVTMYTVICDRCGRDANKDEEYSAWGDKDFAIDAAMDGDWQEIDGKHYCDNCWQWSEDAENIIPKPNGIN